MLYFYWFLILFTVVALTIMSGILAVNWNTFPRLRHYLPANSSTIEPQPIAASETTILPVSILIPARNEARVIGKTVASLRSQTVRPLELLILDDHSTDTTATEVRTTAERADWIRVLPGEPLPAGWLGKNWACWQLAQQARGDWLLFCDADVYWEPDALAALFAAQAALQADLLTVWPTQTTVTWGERLCVPLLAFVILCYLPIPLVHHRPEPSAAAANGQCLLFCRRVYEAIGGHRAVAADIVEDIRLAQACKRLGFALRMADGDLLIRCRMYQGWRETCFGFGKNILAGYGDSLFALFAATCFHWLVFVGPWCWLLAGLLQPQVTTVNLMANDNAHWTVLPDAEVKLLFFQFYYWPTIPMLLILWGLSLRMLTARLTHQRVRDGLLFPVSVLLMTRIALQGVWWRLRYGGPKWKGRTIVRQKTVST